MLKRKLKRFAAGMAAFVLALGMTACGKGDKEKNA